MSGRNNGWEIILNVNFSCCDTDGGGFFAPFSVPCIQKSEYRHAFGENERDEEMDEENDIDVKTAIVPVPSVLPRIIRLPDVSEANSRHCFVFLEDMLMFYAARFLSAMICLKPVHSGLRGMRTFISMRKMPRILWWKWSAN